MEHSNNRLKNSGLTLVELSIVMIIGGLLIGGILAGTRIVENARIQKTIQDLKSIESSFLSFKDIYRAIPGDIMNPSAKLSNCQSAPCSTSGNGNRTIDNSSSWDEPISNTMEKFTAWSQLQSANLLTMSFHNSLNMNFGDGQPASPIKGGYRFFTQDGIAWYCNHYFQKTIIGITGTPDLNFSDATSYRVKCQSMRAIDTKIDDGVAFNGRFIGLNCNMATACADSYMNLNNDGYAWYDIAN